MSRPINLMIVAATMYILRHFLIAPYIDAQCLGMKLQMHPFDFFLSVLAVVLLTAGGNIINDYFDVKVDLINKPERVVIGKTVKRRVAMVLHQSFNIVAMGISIYLCAKYDMWIALAIPIIVATLLWFYSPILKKKVFVGNLVVALCVSAVPIWAGIFEIPAIMHHYVDIHHSPKNLSSTLWLIILTYALFAFLLSLSREAIKDLEDYKGDKEGKYHTMPIAKGKNFTAIYAAFMMLLCLAAVVFTYYKMGFSPTQNQPSALVLGATVIAPGLSSALITLFAKTKRQYGLASLLAKATMAGGLILCVIAGKYLWFC